MDAATLTGVIAAVAIPTATIVGAIYQTATKTRDQIDAVRAGLGAKIDAIQAHLSVVTRDVALLAQRIDAVSAQVADLPASPVGEADCRDRHEATDRRVADLHADIRVASLPVGFLAHVAR